MKLKNKIVKGLSLASAITLMASDMLSLFAFAQSHTKDSHASINMEDDGFDVGVDETQEQKTLYSENIQEDKTEGAEVYVSQASSFGVYIPKTIILDGKKNDEGINKAKYVVTINSESNFAGNEKILVVPDESFVMSQLGKEDIEATILQDKQEWLHNEIDTKGNGEISAIGMSAGSWNGQFNFNISLNNKDYQIPKLQLSIDNELTIGSNDSFQVNATINGENVNELLSWDSNNENITVTNGLIKTKASVQPGDNATITVSGNIPQNTTTYNLKGKNTRNNQPELFAQFAVTIIDMEFTNNNEIVTFLEIKPSESATIKATIIPQMDATVHWSTTAIGGLNLIKNGNEVTIEVAEDMPIGNKYSLIANYGDFSKILEITIISDHICSHKESIEKAATCTTKGITRYTCECGDTYTLENIEVLGHNYESVITKPTCEEKGYTTHTCTRCNDNYVDSEVNELGHKYDENYTTDIIETCANEGSKSQHCLNDNCDSKTNVTTIPKLDHTYGDWTTTKVSTCTEKGTEERTCSSCGYIDIKELNYSHNYTEGTRDISYSFSYSPSIAMTGFNQNGNKYTAPADGVYMASWNITVPEDTNYTLKYKKVLLSETVAGVTITDSFSLSLNDVDVVLANGYETTVTLKLKKGYNTIYGSGINYNGGTVYLVFDPAIIKQPAHICETCDKTGAHYYTKEILQAKTCTTNGLAKYTCNECKKSYEETIAASHNYDAYTTTTAATCTTTGSKYHTCLDCGYVETITITALGHSYGSYITTKAATCTTTGSKYRTCSRCQYVETTTIAKTSHNTKPVFLRQVQNKIDIMGSSIVLGTDYYYRDECQNCSYVSAEYSKPYKL